MPDQISHKFTLLFVDDEKKILSSLKRTFFDEEYLIYTAESGEDALSIMAETEIHAALIDLKMHTMDGLSLLKKIKTRYPHIMVVMLTGHGSIKDAVEAITAGAVDFIEKPFISEKMITRVRQLCRMWELGRENQMLKHEIGFRFRYDKLIGNSSKALELKKMISRVGPSDATVLIQGETGTGKEIVAKAIHHHSARSENSFVVVDCATISENMLESELFGHLKGAFTGAYTAQTGLVQAANHGTLFLDEIGEVPLQIQAKLLRLIQEKEIRPVGSSKSARVDVRILAATNRHLKTEVENRTFREDLYYRIEGVTVNVPTLRDRTDDIHLLTDHFIKKYQTDFSVIRSVSMDALVVMERYTWPGNIRELENVICRIMALSPGTTIQADDFPESIYKPTLPTLHASGSLEDSLEDSLASYEKAAITNALKKSDNNRRIASQLLNIGEATLYRKINKYWPDR